MPQTRPNILFIFTDQHRVDTMGCYGSKICRTPYLDALAADSVVFDRAYTVCPICSPARASLQTGWYPARHGVMSNIYTPGCGVHELPDVPLLLSRRMQKQNYSLGYTGKWHLGTDGRIRPWHGLLTPAKGSLPSDLGYEADDFGGHGGGGFGFPEYEQYLKSEGLQLQFKDREPGPDLWPHKLATEIVSPVETTVEHYLTGRAIQFIDRFAARPQPFFVSLHHWGPHSPYVAPTEYLDLYRNVEIPPWPSFHESGEGKPPIHNFKRAAADKRADWPYFQDCIRHYYGFTSFIDAQIGRLIDHLKQAGLYDDTVIIFSADHGESLGIHGGLEDKSVFMYEETTRIPLLIKPARQRGQTPLPERPEGCCAQRGLTPLPRREGRFAVTTDLYATILDYAGADLAEFPCEGRSLAPLVAGAVAEDWPDCAVTEGSGITPVVFSQRAIRWSDWKYVFNCGDTDELYHLAVDPHEMTNLAGNAAYADTLRQMRRRLAGWMQQHGDRLLKGFEKLRVC